MAGAIYSEAQRAVARVMASSRKEAGLTQGELARAIGKHQSYISDIERGQRRVDVLELFVIARAMKLSATDLYASITLALPDDVAV